MNDGLTISCDKILCCRSGREFLNQKFVELIKRRHFNYNSNTFNSTIIFQRLNHYPQFNHWKLVGRKKKRLWNCLFVGNFPQGCSVPCKVAKSFFFLHLIKYFRDMHIAKNVFISLKNLNIQSLRIFVLENYQKLLNTFGKLSHA